MGLNWPVSPRYSGQTGHQEYLYVRRSSRNWQQHIVRTSYEYLVRATVIDEASRESWPYNSTYVLKMQADLVLLLLGVILPVMTMAMLCELYQISCTRYGVSYHTNQMTHRTWYISWYTRYSTRYQCTRTKYQVPLGYSSSIPSGTLYAYVQQYYETCSRNILRTKTAAVRTRYIATVVFCMSPIIIPGIINEHRQQQ